MEIYPTGIGGEDNATTDSIIVDLNKLPEHCVQICFAVSESKDQTRNPMESIVWFSEEKNILYFGDSVGAANNSGTGEYPAYYINGKPQSKLYGSGDNAGSFRRFVYNAAMELNAVAWAIRKAAASGINPH